jgi:hypothetical protein
MLTIVGRGNPNGSGGGAVAGGEQRPSASDPGQRQSTMKPSLDLSAPVRLQNGCLYLDARVYEAFFGTRDSVPVLSRDQQIALFPLSPDGVGGSFAKIENARGDRVIHAPELLRGLDLDESVSHELVARWDPELSALILARPESRPPRARRH